MGTPNFTSAQELLHGVLDCAARLERISRGLDRVSDGSTLPFNHYECQQLCDSVRCVDQLLATADELVGLQIQRWGL